MITVSKEDYLKAILEAESEGETVISATLAHWLKVSPPAVTMAVRRLKKDGFVRVQADGQVRLTPAGRKIARRLTLRHHLVERMLCEVFGMEWYKVHDEPGHVERLHEAEGLAVDVVRRAGELQIEGVAADAGLLEGAPNREIEQLLRGALVPTRAPVDGGEGCSSCRKRKLESITW